MIDPGKNILKKRKVELRKLIDAMISNEKEKRGGFWLITKTLIFCIFLALVEMKFIFFYENSN